MGNYYIRHDASEKATSTAFSEQEASVFESRVRRRLLRVLVDEATFDNTDASEALRILRGLLGNSLIKCWNYVCTDDNPDGETMVESADARRRVSVREVTGKLGRFELPGLNFSYSFSETEDGAHYRTTGKFQIDPPEITFARAEIVNATDDQKLALKDVETLNEAARCIGADVVLTRRHLNGELPLVKLGIYRLVSPESAVATITHYLRTQGEFVVDVSPRKTVSEEYFYRQALLAYCPHIEHWKAKVTVAAEISAAVPTDHILLIKSAFARFERALRRLDDLILEIGRPPTMTTVDDAVDTLDHILVSLCGGVDALARSLGLALGRKPKSAKLHLAEWVTSHMRAPYGESLEFETLLTRLPALKFVFDMRNSIHEVALMPTFENLADESQMLGRIQLLVPPGYKENWEELSQAESDRWQLQVADNIVQVDLLHFALKAIESVFGYVDTLCELLSFEPVGDNNGPFYPNIRSVFSEEELKTPTFIARTGHLKSPMLDGSYNPSCKRHLETDDHSRLSQELFGLAREAGLLGSGKFAFLDTDAVITTHYESRDGD